MILAIIAASFAKLLQVTNIVGTHRSHFCGMHEPVHGRRNASRLTADVTADDADIRE